METLPYNMSYKYLHNTTIQTTPEVLKDSRILYDFFTVWNGYGKRREVFFIPQCPSCVTRRDERIR